MRTFGSVPSVVVVTLTTLAIAACSNSSDKKTDAVVTTPPVTTAPTFNAVLNANNERPNPTNSAGIGQAQVVVNGTSATYTVTFAGLTGTPIAAHIHGPGSANQAVGILVNFPITVTSNAGTLTGTFTAADIRAAGGAPPITWDSLVTLMKTSNAYVNVHTPTYGGGEIRGQLVAQ
jgi:hypothetical protein